MGLPVSGFPNMNAISMVDEMGREYLTTADFLRNGVPSSILALLVVTTLGYLLMTVVGYWSSWFILFDILCYNNIQHYLP